MATQKTKFRWPEFFGDTASSGKLQEQFIEAPLAAARQEATKVGLELADLLAMLPAAFVDSQRRELTRVQREQRDKDPRVEALQFSIEQAEEFQNTARSGQARVQRVLATVGRQEAVFHGFVSGPDLSPMPGLTVRLRDASGRKQLSAITAEDGYFQIPLDRKGRTGAKAKASAGTGSFATNFGDLFGAGRSESAAADFDEAPPADEAPATDATDQAGVEVVILRRGVEIYTDPEPPVFEGGSVYREYFITEAEKPSTPEVRKFMRQQAYKPAATGKAKTKSK
jgi:hypothetical protein